MEIVIIVGAVALAGLLVLGGLAFLQNRREGTVKAVLAPRQSLSRAAGEADEDGDSDAGTK